jgi:hypothetical protein
MTDGCRGVLGGLKASPVDEKQIQITIAVVIDKSDAAACGLQQIALPIEATKHIRSSQTGLGSDIDESNGNLLVVRQAGEADDASQPKEDKGGNR